MQYCFDLFIPECVVLFCWEYGFRLDFFEALGPNRIVAIIPPVIHMKIATINPEKLKILISKRRSEMKISSAILLQIDVNLLLMDIMYQQSHVIFLTFSYFKQLNVF